MLQDNIETTLLATGAPVSACWSIMVKLNQKSELSNSLRLVTFCTNNVIVWFHT